MTTYTINHCDNAGNGRRNYTYGSYATQREAIEAMLGANMDNLAPMDSDADVYAVPLYRLTNVIEGGEAWEPGNKSLDMGDYTETVIEVSEELAA